MQPIEKRKSFWKVKIWFIFIAHIYAFAIAIPIVFLETDAGNETIKTLGDSLWFVLGSLATIGWGSEIIIHPISKILFAIGFVLTRGSVLLFIISTGRSISGKLSKITLDERLSVIQHSIERINGDIYQLRRDSNHELKSLREKNCHQHSFVATTPQSLIDIVRSTSSRHCVIACAFPPEMLSPEQKDITERFSKKNKVHEITYHTTK
ncbi:hypothetical protein AB4254_08545 [Vibrio breoganii]